MPYQKGIKRRTNLNSPSIPKTINALRQNNYDTFDKNVYETELQNLSSERSQLYSDN